MRQWMTNPLILCQKHLSGEHVEHHMFVGTLRKKRKINGYINNDLMEPLSICIRHDVLAWELIRRQMIKNNGDIKELHQTWIDENEFNQLIEYLPDEQKHHRIDKQNSLNLLLSRCSICTNRYNELLHYSWFDPLSSYYLPPEYDYYTTIS